MYPPAHPEPMNQSTSENASQMINTLHPTNKYIVSVYYFIFKRKKDTIQIKVFFCLLLTRDKMKQSEALLWVSLIVLILFLSCQFCASQTNHSYDDYMGTSVPRLPTPRPNPVPGGPMVKNPSIPRYSLSEISQDTKADLIDYVENAREYMVQAGNIFTLNATNPTTASFQNGMAALRNAFSNIIKASQLLNK